MPRGRDAHWKSLPRRRFLQLLASSGVSLRSLAANRSLLIPPPAPAFEEMPPSVTKINWTHTNGRSPEWYLPETVGAGCGFLDYDNDGWMDIYLVNSGPCDFYTPPQPLRNALYRNNRDGTFTDVTEKAGVPGNAYGMGVAVGDYDADGFPDLYVTQYPRSILYHNNGDGTFTDVTAKAGVAAPAGAPAPSGSTTTTTAASTSSSAASSISTNPKINSAATPSPASAGTASPTSTAPSPAGFSITMATARSPTSAKNPASPRRSEKPGEWSQRTSTTTAGWTSSSATTP